MKKQVLSLALALALLAGTASAAQITSTGVAPAQSGTAYANSDVILLNGKEVEVGFYALRNEKGDPTNYIKLRDLALYLDGTIAQFNVTWSEQDGVGIQTGMSYTSRNGQEGMAPYDGEQRYKVGAATTKVDGKAVAIQCFTLTDGAGGQSTYYKLRDLGQAIGFQVDFDEEQSRVLVNTLGQETSDRLTAGGVLSAINALREEYPEGRKWTNDDSYTSQAVHMTGYGCEGFALICSDAAFGDLPVSATHSDFDAVRVGDLLRINHDTHTVIVLEKKTDSVVVAEGNYNSSIHWDRELTRDSLEAGNFTVRTRYPQG